MITEDDAGRAKALRFERRSVIQNLVMGIAFLLLGVWNLVVRGTSYHFAYVWVAFGVLFLILALYRWRSLQRSLRSG